MRVTIIGAGIAGITAALALHRAGHAVALLERSPSASPVGAGITLAPNAVRILTGLGVDLSAAGFPLLRLSLRTAQGSPLQTIDISRILPGAPPLLAFDRYDLHTALLAALPPGIPIHFDQPYPASPLPEHDLLIGADGIRSAVRESLHGAIPLRYSGTTCWRALAPNPGVHESFEAWGGASRFGVVPLNRDRIYVYLVRTAPRGLPRQTSMNAIRQHFENFAEPVPTILEALTGATLLHHDLEELPAPHWGRDRTLLIGDAAHAMTPNLGQGAGMSIEDAAILPQVVTASNPAQALRILRHKRVAHIQKQSRITGEIAHWQSTPATLLRNALIRITPTSVSDRNYRDVIEPGLGLQSR